MTFQLLTPTITGTMNEQEQRLAQKREVARVALLEWLQEKDHHGTYVDSQADFEPCGIWSFDDALNHAFEMNTDPD